MRFCRPVSCRELIMKIKLAFDEKENNNNNNDNNEETNEEEFNDCLIYIDKHYKCPFFNCVRPEMKVYLA